MIDDTTREQQKAGYRIYAKAYYAANREKILAKKRKREHSRTRTAAAEQAMQERRKASPKIVTTHRCLECGAELPANHHPVDFCDWREYRTHFRREYRAIEVASLPHAAPRRK